MTVSLLQTLKNCNPNFQYNERLAPRRVLTSPEEPVANNGEDNVNGELIIFVNDVLMSESNE